MYHDVVHPGRREESGFASPGADVYKLDWAAFEGHLDALAALGPPVPLEGPAPRDGWALTFDDAGACSLEVARRLAERGWVAHFFAATALLGRPGFATLDELRLIRSLGHVIGSHSHTHPPRFSGLGADGIAAEWAQSLEALTEALGAAPRCASVPGGFSSRLVEAAAAEAGIRELLTSEPTTRAREVDGCVVRGRYAIRRSTPAAQAAALAAGRRLARPRQSAAWMTRGVAKRLLGDAYPRVRGRLLGRQGR
jgi:peptidoglycan/xylan/chitin deacetylase (PgdA/CDA1 family)